MLFGRIGEKMKKASLAMQRSFFSRYSSFLGVVSHRINPVDFKPFSPTKAGFGPIPLPIIFPLPYPLSGNCALIFHTILNHALGRCSTKDLYRF